MERRTTRVSSAQWSILLDFLERNPNMAKSQGYNNSARGRAESSRLWQEVAALMNIEGSGTTKTAKDWSIYVSNYKSKLKKIVADINADASATGGGPPRGSLLTDFDQRFLALMGPGFGQTTSAVSVHPFPDVNSQLSTSTLPQTINGAPVEETIEIELTLENNRMDGSPMNQEQPSIEAPTSPGPEIQVSTPGPSMPRRTRQARYRSRPLAPLDEARRILQQVEMQRAAADAATARALHLIGQNLGRIADAADRFLLHFEGP